MRAASLVRQGWVPAGFAFLAALAVLVMPAAVRAADSTAVRPWYESIAFSGVIETSGSYNFNRPRSGVSALRVFDSADATCQLDLLELVAQRPADRPGRAGFRMDLALGSAMPRVEAAAGLFRDADTGKAGDLDLQQAYVSYLAGIGAGLRVDAGKFVSHLGYEIFDDPDALNDNASRSLLFGYAVPGTHTGLRLSYPVAPEFGVMACVVNGWDNAVDNNRAKSFGAQLSWTPAPALAVFLNGMTGPEQADSAAGRRSVADLVATWKPVARLAVGLNADLGYEADASGPGQDARWRGVAGYARVQVTDRLALAVRGETFRDCQGARTGAIQTVQEFTLTPDFQVTEGLRLRADLRHDWSDTAVFDKKGELVKTQTTLLGQAVLVF